MEPLFIFSDMKVAIQGYEGCFHQMAAYDYYGKDIEIISCDSFRQVAKMVESKQCDAGVMAIENSIAGSIMPNYNLLQSGLLKIEGEVHLHIEQNLLAVKGASIDDIKEIHSHPMAILQCIDYIEGLERDFKIVEANDTASAAKMVSENGDPAIAAIASSLAGELYSLDNIAPDIHTVRNNYTRFLMLVHSDNYTENPEANKASLYFKLSHKRHSLLNALKCLELYEINMSKLQSYPIPEDPFCYLFHTDIEFNSYSDYQSVISLIERQTEELVVCGAYKIGKFI